MTETEITQRLTPIFRKVFREPELVLTPELTAGAVVGWTSLTHMEMIAETEKEFGIRFKLKDLTRLQQQNLGGFIALIAQYLTK